MKSRILAIAALAAATLAIDAHAADTGTPPPPEGNAPATTKAIPRLSSSQLSVLGAANAAEGGTEEDKKKGFLILDEQHPAASWVVANDTPGTYAFAVQHSARDLTPMKIKINGLEYDFKLYPCGQSGTRICSAAVVNLNGSDTLVPIHLMLGDGVTGPIVIRALQVEIPDEYRRPDGPRRVYMPIEPYDPTLVSPSS